jgi:hypothetical protein
MEKQATENNCFATVSHLSVRPYQFTGTYKSAAVSRGAGDRGAEPSPIPIPDGEFEFLRSDLCRYSIEPFHELVIGERVRIRSGVMSGVEGTLVRKGESMRFVLTLDLINQHAAIHVDADSLEPVRA